jgi:hypothetical protein
VSAVVVQRVIQAGARAGETTNQIDQVLPSKDGADAPTSKGKTDDFEF